MGRFIGVDLHKNNFMICIMDSAGEKTYRKFALGEIDAFVQSVDAEDEVAVETTTNTRYFVKKVRHRVKTVRVIDTSQFKVISQSVKKTDANDAEVIALYLSTGLLPEVRMKDEKAAEMESLANTRDKLVKLRTALKNKIHNLLGANGIITAKEFLSSEKGLEKALSYPLSATQQVEMEVLVEQIRSLSQSIAKIDEEIKQRGKGLKGFENITSIKGIGDKSGTILLSVIGDIENFRSRKQLDAYFGIVPRVSNSNETVHHGRITKRGNKLGRTTLVQCTLIAIRYSDYLKTYYSRLKTKKGSGKAIIATARKLLGIIYDTLKNDWIFEDFPNFVLKSA